MALEYDLEKEKNINFLMDYSRGLLLNKFHDEKIFEWQKEKSSLLKKFGVEILNINNREKEEKNKIMNEIDVIFFYYYFFLI